ncbi:hypothetical protein BFT35_08495 [Thermoanaerobacterium thermosaccharolyticum]|uniref:Uncharacterized protein n=1 Tax=Thermoanaerobacterium thermosaccharolyticum TaxID=1517 RepID=A0A231VHK5_THETR|nr:radical SAM protein [Thermoanaerobacterium thermosaccharolyticum]OXT07685.1 hypothetical protein CE561_07605 [Thermoanaerobacterium thermosaccharolyticum]PHO06911.1 hypothetical protein BFT35_08495 [Thermoanaerobacterium thermosaccharolyticum]
MLYVNPKIKWRWENEKYVILNTCMILNKTGGELLDTIKLYNSKEKVLNEFRKKYINIPFETLKCDVEKYIKSLLRYNIIFENVDNFKSSPMIDPYYLNHIRDILGNSLSAPIGIACEITNKCNISCKHCCVDAVNGDINELTTEQWKYIIDQISENRVFVITFTGGEALLREDVFDLIKYSKEKKLGTSLLTNGSLLNVKTLEKLINSGLDSISISIDGVGEVHDEFRGTNGLYKKVISIIPQIVRSNLNFGVITVLHKNIINNLYNLLQSLNDLGVKNVSLAYYRLSGRGSINNILRPNVDDYKKIILTAWDFENKAFHTLNIKYPNLPIFYYKDTIGEENYYKLIKKGKIGLCGAGIVGAVITPNGDIKPCDMSGNIIGGNIFDKDLKYIWENDKIFKELRKIDIYNLYPCNKCKMNHEHKCHQGCKSMPYQFDINMNHLHITDYIREECFNTFNKK